MLRKPWALLVKILAGSAINLLFPSLLRCQSVARVLIILAVIVPSVCAEEIYDLALIGGTVVDPETKLNAKRNVAILGTQIAAVTSDPIRAKREINVDGLVVSPGFIDLHSHGQYNASNKLQALDGVTTALELEIGVYPLEAWYESRRGNAVINYGASVSHIGVRAKILHLFDVGHLISRIYGEVKTLNAVTRASLTPERISEMYLHLESGLEYGGLGIGVAAQYIPGMTVEEERVVFELASRYDSPIFIHAKYSGTQQPKSGLSAIKELIDLAAATRTNVHIAHITSVALGDTRKTLELIANARAKGTNVTTEVYSYDAAGVSLSSAYFDPGWRERYGIDYSDLILSKTGKPLTETSFADARKRGGLVLVKSISESSIESALTGDSTAIASDALPFSNGRGHPRGAGNFARVLGYYVRERGVLSLEEAIRKMTLLPAQIVEPISPEMRMKGRLQRGADADITVFDPVTIDAAATYDNPTLPSKGVRYVVVNGRLIVDESKFVEDAFPGRPVYGRVRDQ